MITTTGISEQPTSNTGNTAIDTPMPKCKSTGDLLEQLSHLFICNSNDKKYICIDLHKLLILHLKGILQSLPKSRAPELIYSALDPILVQNEDFNNKNDDICSDTVSQGSNLNPSNTHVGRSHSADIKLAPKTANSRKLSFSEACSSVKINH